MARVARIDVRFSPLALLRRHVEVERAGDPAARAGAGRGRRGLNLRAGAGAAATGGGRPARGAAGPDARRPAPGDRRARAGRERRRSSTIAHRERAGAGGRCTSRSCRIRGAARPVGRSPRPRTRRSACAGGRVDARGAFDVAARRGHATLRASRARLELEADASIDGDAVAGAGARSRPPIWPRPAARWRATSASRGWRWPGTGGSTLDGGGTVGRAVAARRRRGFRRSRSATHACAGSDARRSGFPNLGRSRGAGRARPARPTLSLGGAAACDRRPSRCTPPAATSRAHARDRGAPAAARRPARPARRRGGDRRSTRCRSVIPRRPGRCAGARGCRSGTAIALSGFELGADAQRLVAELRAGRREADARTSSSSRLDLGRLPRALVPPALGLGGVVDADVDVRAEAGARAAPASPRSAVAGGRIRGHRNLSFELDARTGARPRARRVARARRSGLAAPARGSIFPARGRRATRARRSRSTSTSTTPISPTSPGRRRRQGRRAARREGTRAGLASSSTAASGGRGCRLAVTGRGLAFDEHSVGDLALAVNGEGDGSLAARLTSTAPARTRIDVTTAAVGARDSSPSARRRRRWRARPSRSRARSIGCRWRCWRAPRAAPAASAARCRRSWPSPGRASEPEGTRRRRRRRRDRASGFRPPTRASSWTSTARAVDGAGAGGPRSSARCWPLEARVGLPLGAAAAAGAARGRAARACARCSDRS